MTDHPDNFRPAPVEEDSAPERHTLYHDALTGGWSLSSFRSLAAAAIEGHPELHYAILYCDIKRFKYVNDILNYDAGDRLLHHWGEVIRKGLREHEFYGRIGEDKMAILSHYTEPAELERRFHRMTAAVQEFLSVPGFRFGTEICAGAYLLKDTDLAHPDIYQMLDWANVAQKRIKGQSGSRIAFFSEYISIKSYFTILQNIQDIAFYSNILTLYVA